jgi:hypothetical protein
MYVSDQYILPVSILKSIKQTKFPVDFFLVFILFTYSGTPVCVHTCITFYYFKINIFFVLVVFTCMYVCTCLAAFQ